MTFLKKASIFIAAAILSLPSQGVEIHSGVLEGAWKIVQMGSFQEDGTVLWEFGNGRFTQNLGGHRMASEGYVQKESVLDLGYTSITIIELKGNRMKAKYGPAVYVLEKISNEVVVTPEPRKEISPEIKKQIDELARDAVAYTDEAAQLDCAKAVKNSHRSIDAMIGVGEKNYHDGHLTKAQYEQTSKKLKFLMNAIALDDCQESSGNKKAFYQCMSSDKNLFVSCAKKQM